MMTWEYRVFREDDGTYVIREVYYDDDGSIMACTENAVAPMGESLEELEKDIEWFRQALESPVLTLADIPGRIGKKGPRDRSKTRLLHPSQQRFGALSCLPMYLFQQELED